MKLGRMAFLGCLLLLSTAYGLVFAQAEKSKQKNLALKVEINIEYLVTIGSHARPYH